MAKCKVGLPSVVQLGIQEEEEIYLVPPPPRSQRIKKFGLKEDLQRNCAVDKQASIGDFHQSAFGRAMEEEAK